MKKKTKQNKKNTSNKITSSQNLYISNNNSDI